MECDVTPFIIKYLRADGYFALPVEKYSVVEWKFW